MGIRLPENEEEVRRASGRWESEESRCTQGWQGYDPGREVWSWSRKEASLQQLEEQEVPEMVDAKLRFEAIFCGPFWTSHDPCKYSLLLGEPTKDRV